MSYNIAVVLTGTVVNVVEWNGNTPMSYGKEYDRLAKVDETVGIGDIEQEDGTFLRPVPIEDEAVDEPNNELE